MVKPLTVYKASAGSGKTFTLATEYIRLVVENPISYKNILAVTFTNKATEEMKMRILSQLYGIWKQLPDSADYMKVTCEKTGLTQQVVSERAGMALTNLLHNYNYFRVETIDTFFQSILRNLARELDLTANLRIGLNDVQVEELAVDRLIEDLSSTDIMLQWLLKYIMGNISDDKSWNVIGQIKQFGRTIFHNDYKQISKSLNEKMADPDFFENYIARLNDIRKKALERMKEVAETFFDTLDGERLTVEDFSYGKTGLCSFFLKMKDGLFDESIVGKRVTDCLNAPEKWCKKTHPRRELIVSLADTSLGDILRYAIDERPRQWKLFKSADLTLRHLSQLRLLGSIEQKVRQLNDDANRFLLSDTQQLLHALIDGNDSPFIFEKTGTQLEHIMIDEFQDTSTVQWQNFKVLLSETMSHEDTGNLIVGDVKQSIYRWRSGDWRLLNDIQSQFPMPEQQLDILTLGTNYRSQRRIIQFNNLFFRTAANLEYLALQDLPGAGQLQKAYADVEQAIPEKRPDKGYVSICLLPAEDYLQRVLTEIVETVRKLMAAGISTDKMAILVRFNSHIPIIAEYFSQQMPEVRIVSDEAFRLDASIAVNLLIQALHLLAHPDDIMAKAHVAKIYQRQILGSKALDSEILLRNRPLDALLPEEYIARQQELITLPLYELVEKLYALFSLSKLEGQSAYICAFYDHLAEYTRENIPDIDSFVAHWDETLCSKTIQSDEINGIRLISIHKSKGLEFEHVIIPFCDWQLEKAGDILWCQPKEAPFNELPVIPVDYSQKQLTGTIFESDYQDEHLQKVVDNLNLLYVGFTRACSSLSVIGRRNAKSSRSGVIEQAIPLVSEKMPEAIISGLEDDHSPITFEYGTHPSASPAVSPSGTSPSPTENVFLQPVTTLPLKIRAYEQRAVFRQSNRSRDFISGDDEETQQQKQYIQTGNILHQVFSTIRTSDDIDKALRQLQLEGVLYDETHTASRITAMLRKRLENPVVADWFSHRWTLYNECTIISYADGEIQERRPDRVMTDGHEWIVVDFKFGSPKPEYQEQVQEYMQLLASMGHSPVRGYLWYVYANRIEEITLNPKQ